MKKLLFVFLILTATGADAGLNKWVDANGNIHYSDQPPPAGVEIGTLRKAPPPAIEPATTKSYAERDAELKKARQSQAETAEREALKKSNAETEKANCAAAQQALRSLQQGGRIVEYDETGKLHYLEDNERRQRAAEAQQGVEQWCK